MAKRIIKDRDRIICDGWRLREQGEDGIAVDILLVCTDYQYQYQDCSRIMFDWDNGEADHTVEDMDYLMDQMHDWVYNRYDWAYCDISNICSPLLDATPSERYAGWLFVVEADDEDDKDHYFWTQHGARNFLAKRKAKRQKQAAKKAAAANNA